MILGKKERRIAIAIGLIIGVTISSMLVRHALDIKEKQTSTKPGNYNSMNTAVGMIKFPPVPVSLKAAIPNGIVVHFENNRSTITEKKDMNVNTWVIETSGSFRSERLFILAEVAVGDDDEIRFFRASEIYVKLKNAKSLEEFEKLLEHDEYKIIGKNSSTMEHILQLRNFFPSDLTQAHEFLNSLPMVASTRFSDWAPTP